MTLEEKRIDYRKKHRRCQNCEHYNFMCSLTCGYKQQTYYKCTVSGRYVIHPKLKGLFCKYFSVGEEKDEISTN